MTGQVRSLWKPAKWVLLAVVVAGITYVLVQPDAQAQQVGPHGGYGQEERSGGRRRYGTPRSQPRMYRRQGGRMQQRPGGDQMAGRHRRPGVNLTANDEYVYVLAGRHLLQFDADSLELVNKTLLKRDRDEAEADEGMHPRRRMRPHRPRRGTGEGPTERPEWREQRRRGGWRRPDEE